MDTTQVYAIVIGSCFGFLLLVNYLPLLARLSPLIYKSLVYRYILHRHSLLGPWSLAGVLVQLIYIAGNICCLQFWDSTISQVGLRAGTLSLINLIPLFAVPHLSTFADLLGLPLSMFRQIHRSAGVMTVALTITHILLTGATLLSFPLGLPRNLFAVIGASSLCGATLLSIPLLRRPSYELFLRSHQAWAALSAYSIWRHLSPKITSRIYLYIPAGVFLFMCMVQVSIIIHQNGVFYYGRARARITHEYGAVRVRIQLQKPLKVKAGQSINLWIPSVSFWSFLQSHPFVVISWAETPQHYLDLFIEPRRGLTKELLYHAKNVHAINPLVLFSGPHGKSEPMNGFQNILMIASDFGIAAHLPYLKQLIDGYNSREVRARRIHLVWQVRNIGVTIAAQPLLNVALNEDTLDDGWILAISIYCESDIGEHSFGKRAKVYPGKAPLRDIVQAEAAGEYIDKEMVHTIGLKTKTPMEEELGAGAQSVRDGKLLVTVSGSDSIRDMLRSVVREHLTNGVSVCELDYQPS